MPLWRRGRVARQRPAKPRTAVRVRSSPSSRVWPRALAAGPSPACAALAPLAALHSGPRARCTVTPRYACQRRARRARAPHSVWPRALAAGPSPPRGAVVLALLALVVAACGTQEQSDPAAQLVPQLSDLPAGFNLVPAESFPIPTSKILAEPPWSASASAIIRRERLSGYQQSLRTPTAHTIACSAALYRSSESARKVYRSRTTSVASFVDELGGRSLPMPAIGEETDAYRFDIGRAEYLGVAWRSRDVLSTCVGSGSSTAAMAEILIVARAQQARIARGH